MKFTRRLLFTFAFVVAADAPAAEPAQSAWVRADASGKLTYQTTAAGDRIMDFSHAGYRGGGVPLPEVPVKETVRPSGEADDAAAIQAAIDRVAARPLENGFRGAVLLAPGVFPVSRPLTIAASGVVLRGSGSAPGANRSTLQLTGQPHNAITVRGAAAPRGSGADSGGARTLITDAYVPSGANRFSVAEAGGFAVGDPILIQRPVTEAWVKLMQMHDLTRDGRPQTWLRAGTTTDHERRIAAISGHTITLDVPLPDSFDAKYLNPPGTSVMKITPPARVAQVGIENLHIESPRQEISHEQRHFTALRINGEDCWARDLVIDETMNSVGIGGRRITLQRVTVNRQAKHQGASKPAEFAPNGTQVLLDRCDVNADNVWFIATGAGVSGPIVALNCTFNGSGRSEAHQRWSTGMLFDNCRAPQGGFELRNRGAMGSGHGWAMGWGVLWNCVAEELLAQDPPGAKNWLIGNVGHSAASARPFGSAPVLAGGTEDSPGRPVAPRSLYLAQLAERLGPGALKAVGYESASHVAPASSRQPRMAGKDAGAAPENLARDRPVLTSNVRGNDRRHAGWQALDADDATYWATDDGAANARLELDTEGSIAMNALELAEPRGLEGQVRGWRVEGFSESEWKTLAEGTTISGRLRQRFPTVTVWKVRLTITKAEPFAAIGTFGLYREK